MKIPERMQGRKGKGLEKKLWQMDLSPQTKTPSYVTGYE